MNKIYLGFMAAVLLVFSISNNSFSQCSTCTPNVALLSPASAYPEGGLAPDPVPPVTQGNPFDTTMTFIMPSTYDAGAPVGVVDISQVIISTINGLPPGINWTCNVSNCTYFPQSDQYGCIQFCGTTFATPGTYPIVVTVLGTADVGGGVTQPIDFNTELVVLPATGGNTGFSFSPIAGCDEVTSTFEGLIDGSPYPTSYDWTFANGNTATGQTPPDQTFSTAGDNEITLETTIYDYVLESITATAIDGYWGDVEEGLLTPNGEPDMVWDLRNANGITVESGAEVTEQLTATWSNINYVLDPNANPYSLQFTDIDGLSQDDDLGGPSFNVNAAGTFTQIGSNISVTYTIGLAVNNVVTNTDTVIVNTSPDDAVITNAGTDIFCEGDSALLTASNSSPTVSYQWFNDTTSLTGSVSNELWVSESGIYRVELYDTLTFCIAESNDYTIAVEAFPSIPVISYNAVGNQLEVTAGDFNVQWYLDGTPILGETSESLSGLISSGPYTVELTSTNGCSQVSFPYSLCIPGTVETLLTDTICCGESMDFIAEGFAINPSSTIAWAVTPEVEGPVTNQLEASAAQDNGYLLVELNDTVSFSRNCLTLNDSLVTGDYFVTPFVIENPVLQELTYDTLQGCAPFAEICPTLSAVDDNWEIFPMIFTFPDGSTLNVNDAVAFGLPINQPLLDLAGGLPCLALTDLFAGNPNGVWSISVTNTGTTAIDMSVPDFIVINYADSCNLITEDELYTIEALDVTANPGETVTASFNLPPLPGNFPSVNENCSAFGDAVKIHFANCFPEETNNLVVTGITTNPTLDFQSNYIYGTIDVTVDGGTAPFTYTWSDGSATSEDRLGLLPGTYTVTVTDANGLMASETFVLTGPYLGINELEQFGFSLGQSVPNPTPDNATISFNSKERGNYTFLVRDASGRMVTTMTVSANQGENKILFDGSALSAGLYSYSLTNGVNSLSNRMIISK